jgi:hypothetical protein
MFETQAKTKSDTGNIKWLKLCGGQAYDFSYVLTAESNEYSVGIIS